MKIKGKAKIFIVAHGRYCNAYAKKPGPDKEDTNKTQKGICPYDLDGSGWDCMLYDKERTVDDGDWNCVRLPECLRDFPKRGKK